MLFSLNTDEGTMAKNKPAKGKALTKTAIYQELAQTAG